MAEELSKKFQKKDPLFLGVLNGSFIFLADLVRYMSINCDVDFVQLKSYVGMDSSGDVQILKDISFDLKNRDVIIVEDIIETGITLNYLMKRIDRYRPNSVTIVTLLKKNIKTTFNFKIDMIGFEISKDFVVGYGLDYNQKYRNLGGIYRILINKSK
tara:strand:+ start:413 stop:883 length:471 start_codon:yes stop_codon:yes gene_type:complete